MALKFKLVLFLAVVFVFLGVADVSFAASNCYWGCGGQESYRCSGRDLNGEGSDCGWVCDTSRTLICVDPENSSAICNLGWGCPNPIYECRGKDKNGEGSNCDWYCQGSGPACNGGEGGSAGPSVLAPTPTPQPGCTLNGGSVISAGFNRASDEGPEKASDGYSNTHYSANNTQQQCQDDPKNEDKQICEQVTVPEVYIGRSYSSPVLMRQVSAMDTRDYTFNGPLQYSDNGSSWIATGFSFAIPRQNLGVNTISLPNLGRHKYWRVLDSRDDAYHHIGELQFLDCQEDPPVVDIKANGSNGPISITYNTAADLSWTATGTVNSCTASNGWSGDKPVNGSQSTNNITTSKTYTLTCTGPGGSDDDSVTVNVSSPVPNNPSSVNATQPDYCISGPAATVTWSYSDPSGSPQQSYQVQIDDQGSFGSPEVDSGKVNSGSTSYYSGQGSLQFNTTYKARVRVWNSYDVASDWTVSGSFKTPEFAYPQVNFTWSANGVNEPPSPPKGSQIQFTDQTVFQGNQTQREWDWNFGDSTTSTQQNPIKVYGNLGTYYVTLTATDSRNQTCSRTRGPLSVQRSVPKWKEIAPR